MEKLASENIEAVRALFALRGSGGPEASPYQEMLDEIRRRQAEAKARHSEAVDPNEKLGLRHESALLADLAVWACQRRNAAYE